MKRQIFTCCLFAAFSNLMCSAADAPPSPPKYTECGLSASLGYHVSETGWVFENSEIRSDFPETGIVSPYIKELAKKLSEAHITLVPVIIPSRPMIYPPTLRDQRKWGKSFDANRARKSYNSLYNDLRASNVVLPNVLSTFLRNRDIPQFFYGDHHITPAGAKNIALATQQVLSNSPVYRGVNKTKFTLSTENQQVNPDPSRAHFLAGCGAQPVEPYLPVKAEAESSGGLLDDEVSEVVYVGTSMGRAAWGLPSYLEYFLSTDLLDFHTEAGGVYVSLLNYFLSTSYKSSPAKIILWEIPFEEFIYSREGSPKSTDIRYFDQIFASLSPCTSSVYSSKIMEKSTRLDFASELNIRDGDFFRLTSTSPLAGVDITTNLSNLPVHADIPARLETKNEIDVLIHQSGKISSLQINLQEQPKDAVSFQICQSLTTGY